MQHLRRRKKKVIEQLNAFLNLRGQQVTPAAATPRPAPSAPATPTQQPAKINYGNFAQSPATQSTSLKNLHAGALQARRQSANVVSQQTVNKPVTLVSHPGVSIDKTAFFTAWKQYATNIAQSDARLYNLMVSEPEIKGNEITVKVQNQYQIQDITGNAGLTSYLRNALKNNNLYITAIVDVKSAEQKQVVYTSRQQYDKMCEQNKELAHLMEKYGFFLDS